jgi:cysteinyl-tRNA synthetase, unknown class
MRASIISQHAKLTTTLAAVFAFATLTTFVPVNAQTQNASTAARPKIALKNVDSWGYQLQNVKPRVFAEDGFDVLIVDYSLNGTQSQALTPSDVAALRYRGGKTDRLVLAYLSIGEAEDYRFYWQDAWTSKPELPAPQAKLPRGFLGPPDGSTVGMPIADAPLAKLNPAAPSWLADENPEWRGNYLVRYWDPQWQAIIFGSPQGYLDQIIAAGFDGVYIDKIDSNDDWEKSRPSAPRDMVDFVKAIAKYAKAIQPGFLIVPQNGEELLKFPDYVKTIDAIAKESLLFGTGKLTDNQRNPDAEIRKSKRLLDKARRAKKPVFVVEYIDQLPSIMQANSRLLSYRYIPTFARRALDEHPPVAVPALTARPPKQ